MKTWPKHPVIYEINTWVWLAELSRKYRRPVNLNRYVEHHAIYLSNRSCRNTSSQQSLAIRHVHPDDAQREYAYGADSKGWYIF